MSFGPYRAGSFLPAEVGSDLATGGNFNGRFTTNAAVVNKFKKSYKKSPATQLTKEEVMLLLLDSNLFSSEVAALFVGLAERESRFRPGGLNGDRGTGDFSFGLWQINLLPAAHGTKTFILKSPNEAKVLGLKLAYSIDSDNQIDSLSRKVKEIADRDSTDSRIFIPYNQSYMLVTTAAGETKLTELLKNGKQLTGYLFGAWGDYKVPQGNSVIGCLADTRYSVVRDVYLSSTNKNEETLKQWLVKVFDGKPGEKYLQDWMNGKIIANNGTVKVDKDF